MGAGLTKLSTKVTNYWTVMGAKEAGTLQVGDMVGWNGWVAWVGGMGG